MNSTAAVTTVSNKVGIFDRLSIDCIQEIASFVPPTEIASLNRTARQIAETAFDDLQALYMRSESVQPFMPSLVAQNMSGREVVKQTVANIFLFGKITGQYFSKSLRLSNLQSILSFATTMDADNRGLIIYQICKSRPLQAIHTQMVRVLIASGPIGDWDRGMAVGYSARNEYLVRTLLASGPIEDWHRGQAVAEAAQNGHLEIVQELLTNGPIGDAHRSLAVACANEHLEIVRALLASGPIDLGPRGMALVTAARRGHPEMVRVLLANGPIGAQHRGEAIVIATRNGHLEIAEELRLEQ
jgi:hypothetical protein